MIVYKVKTTRIVRKCEGCKEDIKKYSPCVYGTKSFKGFPFKVFYHNKECANLDDKI